jgi:hypothetical protein
MKAFVRWGSVCSTCLLWLSAISFCQSTKPNLATAKPGYGEMPKVNINSVQLPSSSIRFVLPKGVTSTKGIFLNDGNSSGAASRASYSHSANTSPSIRGLNTVPTFVGAFNSTSPSIDFYQSSDGFTTTSPYIMMGNNPLLGGTTEIPAKITTVSVQLLNPDGSIFATVPYAPFENLTLDSPNFRDSNYSVGHTQFGDAVQRAEFYNMMESNWHTLLTPTIVNRATIQVPATVELIFFDGTILTVPAYYTSTAPDGSTVVLMLDLLFSALDFNQIVNDINGGYFTTDAMNYHAYPNTYLFSVIDELGDTSCCVLGFHEYVFDPSTNPESRWIYAYASWMSAGLFGAGAQDVTAMSHETSEALNDPFGNNIVPTWQFPGLPGYCQANLETGDPVEVLPVSTVPITTRVKGKVFTYHPQTEALLQWFEIGNPSNAIGGAFSYPNVNALTQAATPCF